MASGFSPPHQHKQQGQEYPSEFPPQHQNKQPGLEYVMTPLPIPISEGYRPSNRLQGKVALVTGGDSGIGRAVCYHFALEGATVAFTYVIKVEDKDAADTIEKIKQLKSPDAQDPISIPADVGFDENCKMVVDKVVEAFGRIDILVNHAGEVHIRESIAEITPAALERVFRTNFFSQVYMTRHALEHMSRGSCIINTSSVAAYLGDPSLPDYAATKGAIVGFTRSLSLRLITQGIRVNGVAPGPIWTPLIPAVYAAEDVATFGQDWPIGRAGQPCEVAPAYVFLASQDASYISGQFIHPNGGRIVNG